MQHPITNPAPAIVREYSWVNTHGPLYPLLSQYLAPKDPLAAARPFLCLLTKGIYLKFGPEVVGWKNDLRSSRQRPKRCLPLNKTDILETLVPITSLLCIVRHNGKVLSDVEVQCHHCSRWDSATVWPVPIFIVGLLIFIVLQIYGCVFRLLFERFIWILTILGRDLFVDPISRDRPFRFTRTSFFTRWQNKADICII